jgi:uncharacterized membrane protein
MSQSDREGSLGVERIVFFSDAVIAIAITLLVIEIRVPEIPSGLIAAELPGRLLALSPSYLSYFISFFVIGLYWMLHHRIFNYIRRFDRGLIWLNLVFLFFIAFLPFPTAVLGAYPAEQAAVILYAISVAAIGLAKVGLWWYASRRYRLIDRALEPGAIRAEARRGLIAPVVFLLSIGLALFDPQLAMYSWIVVLPASLLYRSRLA